MTNILYEFQITVDGEYQKHYIRAKGMDEAVRQLKKAINNKSYILISAQKKGDKTWITEQLTNDTPR